jgi:serine protease Do
MCGFSPSSSQFDILGSAAYAGASNETSRAAQPIGFADTVERVKPSVISVKVTMKDKTTNASAKDEDGELGSPMERFLISSAVRMEDLRIPGVTVGRAK